MQKREKLSKRVTHNIFQNPTCVVCGSELKNTRYIFFLYAIKNICLSCVSTFTSYKKDKSINSSELWIIMDCSPIYLFNSDWNSNEEVLLLCLIQKYGLDNWRKISLFFLGKKKEDIKLHYYSLYFGHNNSPLPSIPSHVQSSPKSKIVTAYDSSVVRIPDPYTAQEGTIGINFQYMPERHEFAVTYLDDAEILISNLFFIEDDTQTIFNEKIKQLILYNKVVCERKHRTNIIEINNIQCKSTRYLLKNEPLLKSYCNEQRIINSELTNFIADSSIKDIQKLSNSIFKRRKLIKDIYHIYNKYIGTENSLQSKSVMLSLSLINKKKFNLDHFNQLSRIIGTCNKLYWENILSNDEKQYIKSENIQEEEYFCVKNFIIREYILNPDITFNKLVKMAKNYNEDRIRAIAYHLKRNQII